ncbi:MAG: hypothetical protein P4L22_05840 [Candidatus Babeliales bacterium]|nr:hypothetical protein [Candidatus Babeliales bacterium]
MKTYLQLLILITLQNIIFSLNCAFTFIQNNTDHELIIVYGGGESSYELASIELGCIQSTEIPANAGYVFIMYEPIELEESNFRFDEIRKNWLLIRNVTGYDIKYLPPGIQTPFVLKNDEATLTSNKGFIFIQGIDIQKLSSTTP